MESKWKETLDYLFATEDEQEGGENVKKRPKKRKDFDDLAETALKICGKIFWPVFILWIIFALAKIMIDFGLIT